MVDTHGECPRFEIELELEEKPHDIDRVISTVTCGTQGELGVGVEGGTPLGVEGGIRGGIAEDIEHVEEGGSMGWRFALGARNGRQSGTESVCRRRVFWQVEVGPEKGRGVRWEECREVF